MAGRWIKRRFRISAAVQRLQGTSAGANTGTEIAVGMHEADGIPCRWRTLFWSQEGFHDCVECLRGDLGLKADGMQGGTPSSNIMICAETNFHVKFP